MDDARYLEFWPDWEAGTAFLASATLAALGVLARRFAWRTESAADTSTSLGSVVRQFIDRLFLVHERVYDRIAGVHPHRRPWHLQWLSVKDIYCHLHPRLTALDGDVLDVGCFRKPFAPWLNHARRHVGVDVWPGEFVDHVIRDGERWPIETGSFESVLCTQVLQVVRDVPHLIDEVDRILVPGGTALITVPFCYNDQSTRGERGIYRDYWRFSVHGLQEVVGRRLTIQEVIPLGGAGSTGGVLVLNWIYLSLSGTSATRVLLMLMLPLWLLFCWAVNIIGWLIDKLDRTGIFYHGVFLVARKPVGPSGDSASAV